MKLIFFVYCLLFFSYLWPDQLPNFQISKEAEEFRSGSVSLRKETFDNKFRAVFHPSREDRCAQLDQGRQLELQDILFIWRELIYILLINKMSRII